MLTHPLDSPGVYPLETVTFADLCEACSVSADELDELIAYGALVAQPGVEQALVFDAHCITPLRQARQVCKDYDLEFFMVVILLDLLQRNTALEQQLAQSKRVVAALRAESPVW
jgi:hypothetical protein